ncbi:MAG: hypothetical protein WBG50_00095 [Desulfomonilaceae bacterium]
MKNLGVFSRVSLLPLVVLLGSVCDVRSQDVFREMDQIKKQVSDLKNEVNKLRSLVYDLRGAVIKCAVAPAQQAPQVAPPKQEATTKPVPPVNEDQVTKAACRAVGKFFSEAKASLRERDPSAASARMRTALRNMNAALKEYAKTHRVSKLLGIYEGLAWDTYVAVELRQSIQGNEAFLKALRKHEEKYYETCPKE